MFTCSCFVVVFTVLILFELEEELLIMNSNWGDDANTQENVIGIQLYTSINNIENNVKKTKK